MPAGVRLSGGPILSETEVSAWESEVSSVIDIGDRCLPSESEDELADKQKYRLPDVGKTRLNLLTKEPLSPSRRAVPRTPDTSQRKMPPPTTPRSDRSMGLPGSPLAYRMRMGSSENVNAIDGEYFPSDISRAGSIYSLSRVSFAGQIAQLTSIRLPDATLLAKKISSIPTASEAAIALTDASERIHLWIAKAAEVLNGLSADDDIEWAAAGGRDGIEEVDLAISRFEKLVDIYISSIEKLQTRDDAKTLTSAELTGSVKQMESIISCWSNIKTRLQHIKDQVQLALDWEALWNTDLGEIAQDMAQLSRYIFELEENRHQGSERFFTASGSVDLNELESILEEQPKNMLAAKLTTPGSPLPCFATMVDNAATYTLELGARMKPLRTALDFLPMKLSTFHIRANNVFPTACKELQDRRDELEEQWKKIDREAKALRDELGDDKWVCVFRNAGSQASKMCDSIERTFGKTKSALEANEHVLNRDATIAKIGDYQTKKLHYSPAIEQVLNMTERAIKSRLTINGDVLRHMSQLRTRWAELQSRMKTLDRSITELNMDKRDRQLRDSVSTILSSERSMLSSALETPGTSPASSVIGASRKSSFHGTRTPVQAGNTPSTASRTSDRRISGSLPRRSGLFNRTSISDFRSSPSPAPSSSSTVQWPHRPLVTDDNKPKWNNSTRAAQRDFAPLSKFEPSPYAKKTIPASRQTPRPQSSTKRVVSEPVQEQVILDRERRRSAFLVPQTPDRRATSALGQHTSRLSITPLLTGRRSRLSNVAPSMSDGNDADIDAPARNLQRPPSSLDRTSKRNSILPGRIRKEADQATAGVEKPKWR